MSKQDEPNHLLQNTNGKLAFSNPFSSSPRASPGLSEQQRNQDISIANTGIGSLNPNDGHGPSQGIRFNAPVFRPSFSEDAQGPIHRALDPIAPDQREPVANDSYLPSGASASFRMMEGERPYPHLEAHSSSRERSLIGHMVDSTDDGPGPVMNHNPHPPPPGIFRQASLGGGISPFAIQRQNSFSNSLTPRHSVSQDNIQNNNSNYVSSALSGPPVTLNTAPAQQPPIIHDHVLASSPVSSVSAPSASSALIGSGISGQDKSFDSQIKTSPFLHDILDRVIRTEYAQRDLAREVGALTNKINFLVERLEHTDSRRSFSASPIPGMGNHNVNISPLAGGGLHQSNMGGGGRDDGDISKRLDALTNSVQQILMIQQHGHNNNNNGPHHPSFHGNGPLSPGGGGGPGPGGFDSMAPNISLNGPGIMGPNRPHSRNPPPPVRTWSAGSLDMPLRQDVHLSRPDALLNQKRRSVVGNLVRRDSAAVRISFLQTFTTLTQM